MGCIGSKSEKIAAERSKEIEKQLQHDSRRMRRQLKLLLLGAGESGKSTFVKQCKIIHSGGYTEEERLSYKKVVHENVFHSAIAILKAMISLKIPLSDQTKTSEAEYLLSFGNQNDAKMPNILNAITKLYSDAGFRSTLLRSNEFVLNDSAEYFFNALNRIASPTYLPTQEDVLRTRVRTTGIVETKFKHREFEVFLCDVGGQRSERKKWIHCFENVTAILFVVALSEYDLKLREDEETNRMHESLMLLKSLCDNSLFRRTDIILLMNKIDLFAEKIRHTPISVCFPHYQGPNSYEETREYILEQFISASKSENLDRQLYHHFTCATDTSSVQFVFNAVTDSIIARNLTNYGLC